MCSLTSAWDLRRPRLLDTAIAQRLRRVRFDESKERGSKFLALGEDDDRLCDFDGDQVGELVAVPGHLSEVVIEVRSDTAIAQ